MIRHDFRQGILKRLLWFLVPLGLFCVVVLTSRGTFDLVNSETGQQPSLGAYLYYIFSGCLPADATEKDFTPDLVWILIHIGCLLLTIEYPSRDLESSYGTQILVRGSRCMWWISKCLWNIVIVCLYYAALYFAAAVYCLCAGMSCSLALGEDIIMFLLDGMSMTQPDFSGSELVPVLLCMPVFSMMAISLWQMTIAIFWHPIYGFATAIMLLVWSSFSQTPLAVGNYAMMQRCNLFYYEGLSFSDGCWVVLMYILLAVLVGGIVMKRRDIFKTLSLES